MPYSTLADVEHAAGGAVRLAQLADWHDGASATLPERVADAIAKSDALIDSYASKRFRVPFDPVPPIIVEHSATLAKLRIARRRGQFSQDQQDEWDSIAGPKGWLFLLATGVVTPGGDPLPPSHGSLSVDSVDTTLPSDRDVSREKLGGFW